MGCSSCIRTPFSNAVDHPKAKEQTQRTTVSAMPPIPASGPLLFANEINRSSLRHIRSELQGVPIRQSYASVRLRLANFARFRSAVNAVTFTRQTNPNDTHWIV